MSNKKPSNRGGRRGMLHVTHLPASFRKSSERNPESKAEDKDKKTDEQPSGEEESSGDTN